MDFLSSIPWLAYTSSPDHTDLEKFEIFDGVIDVADEMRDLPQLMQALGRAVPTKNREYKSYTNQFLYDAITFTHTAGDDSIAADTEANLTVSSTARVRANEIGMLESGEQFYVREVTDATTLKIKTIDAFPNGADGTALTISFFSNAIEEGGSGSYKPETPLVKYTNQVQAFETSIKVSDFLKAGQMLIKMPNGKHAYYYRLESELYKKHQLDIAFQMVLGKKATLTTTEQPNTIRTSRGLNDYVASQGGVTSTTAGTSVAKSDFKTWSRLLDAQMSPTSGFLWSGANINNSIDDAFDTIMGAGNIDYSVFGKGDAKQKAIDLGVNTFHVYGRTFFKSKLGVLDHPEVTNVTDAKWPQYAYYVPTTKIKTENGEMADRIRTRYMEIDGVDSRWHVKELGGLAPVPTNRGNYFELSVTSWEGLEVIGTKHLGRLELATS